MSLADSQTASLQATVAHRAKTGIGSQGPTYSASVNRQGIVDYAPRLVQLRDGIEVSPKATVIFPRPVAISPGDEITLPNGVVGEVLDTPGIADPSTGRPYAAEVFVG